jgi:hypothetical protein
VNTTNVEKHFTISSMGFRMQQFVDIICVVRADPLLVNILWSCNIGSLFLHRYPGLVEDMVQSIDTDSFGGQLPPHPFLLVENAISPPVPVPPFVAEKRSVASCQLLATQSDL